MPAKPKTIDDFLAAMREDQRATLEKLRKAILAAAPQANECISYGLAAFRLNGKPLVAMGATANHCAFYLMSSSTVDAHPKELKSYDTSKGTIRFPADKPLPAALVRKLVKARMAENEPTNRPVKSKPVSARPTKKAPADDVNAVVATLKRLGTKQVRDGMVRFAIPSDKAFGIPVGTVRKEAKRLGVNHELAAKLWDTGWYEARMLAAFVDDPSQVTPAQMDRWCRDFDSWAICDTACFHFFDRTPHAFRKVAQWSLRREEFVKRAAFALLASLALHDKQTGDEPFLECLPLIEQAATDERNFVKKGVNWALRAVGERNPTLHAAAVTVAEHLAASADTTARWVGKDALRKLSSPVVTKRLASRWRTPSVRG